MRTQYIVCARRNLQQVAAVNVDDNIDFVCIAVNANQLVGNFLKQHLLGVLLII
jgi:hypothetical protein